MISRFSQEVEVEDDEDSSSISPFPSPWTTLVVVIVPPLELLADGCGACSLELLLVKMVGTVSSNLPNGRDVFPTFPFLSKKPLTEETNEDGWPWLDGWSRRWAPRDSCLDNRTDLTWNR